MEDLKITIKIRQENSISNFFRFIKKTGHKRIEIEMLSSYSFRRFRGFKNI